MFHVALLNIVLVLAIGVDLYRTSLVVGTVVPGTVAPPQLKRADFRGESASGEARQVADWVVHSGDHKTLPFIIIDKVEAKLFAFDSSGALLQATPVLLGMGIGDTFAARVTYMDMYATQPWQRITPAGRFEADEGENLKGEKLLWVDYEAAIAIHKLPARKTKQRRQERLESASPEDNRITYGCINVPAAFYDDVVGRDFAAAGGIVYVLPEKLPAQALFGSYEPRWPASQSSSRTERSRQ